MSPSSSRYSLSGVRAATVAPQEAFIATARKVLEADDRVLAAYLVGVSPSASATPSAMWTSRCLWPTRRHRRSPKRGST